MLAYISRPHVDALHMHLMNNRKTGRIEATPRRLRHVADRWVGGTNEKEGLASTGVGLEFSSIGNIS